VSLGPTNLVAPTAELCGLPTMQGIGPDQLQLTERKSTTNGEGSYQLPRTEGNSRPRHKGAAKAARDWRLGPTDYELCSSGLK
jgi:hypothetical protein